MYCPSCGKDNIPECKFCASCGTNLEVVTRALYTSSVGLFTRFDSAFNQFIARYSERVFKNAPTTALSRRLADSWKIFGQGFLTSAVDFVLLGFMLYLILPLRLITLLISSPFRLLMGRSNRMASMKEVKSREKLPDSEADRWPAGHMISVVDHTTEHLADYKGRDSMAE